MILLKNTKKLVNKMFDFVDQILDNIAFSIFRKKISANIITFSGFLIGISAVNFISLGEYMTAFVLILINRFFDIIDGRVARKNGITNFGIFFETCLNYILYGAIIFSFAWANPQNNAVSATFLLFSFATSVTAILSYKIIAHKIESRQSPFYLSGFAQGFETLIILSSLCFFPLYFKEIAVLFGVLCIIKTLNIIASAYYNFEFLVKNEK